MPSIVQSRYDQGLAAYRAGHGIRHVVEVLNEIETIARGAQEDPGANFNHDAGPSVIAGFADGLIADIRLLANQRRGQTA